MCYLQNSWLDAWKEGVGVRSVGKWPVVPVSLQQRPWGSHTVQMGRKCVLVELELVYPGPVRTEQPPGQTHDPFLRPGALLCTDQLAPLLSKGGMEERNLNFS